MNGVTAGGRKITIFIAVLVVLVGAFLFVFLEIHELLAVSSWRADFLAIHFV